MKLPRTSTRALTVLIAGEDPAVAKCREILEGEAKELALQVRTVEFNDVAAAMSGLQQPSLGELSITLLLPALDTWSRMPHFNSCGTPYLRSAEYPWGLPWLSPESSQFTRLQKANQKVLNTINLARTALQQNPKMVLLLLHPEDLGQCGVSRPASIWQLPEVHNLAREFCLSRHAAYQCEWGESEFRAPVAMLSIVSLGKDFAKGWPVFQGTANSQYRGPLPPDCKCAQTHPKTSEMSRSTRKSTSFMAKPFLSQLARLALKKVLKLRLADGGKSGLAQSEEEDSSGTEGQCWSELEEYGQQGVRPYKWEPPSEELQEASNQAGT